MIPLHVPGASAEVLEVARLVRTWADRELLPKRPTLGESNDGLLMPALAVLREELGLGELIQAEGGITGDVGEEPLVWALSLLEVGRGDCGLGLLITAELALHRAGGECDGERVALALPRLPRGDELGLPALGGRSPQAAAREAGEGWRVSADQVTPLCGGLDADLLAVVCAVAGEGGGEPLLALVPTAGAGVTVGEPILQTGLAASRNASIWLQDAPAQGVMPFGSLERGTLEAWLRLGLAGVCTGALEMGLQILTDWAESRVIKGRGQPFLDNPLVAGVMAEVAEDLLVSRALLVDAGRQFMGQGGHLIVGMAWHRISALVERSLGRAMELMGSAGYAREWQLERYWRDVRTLRGLLGSPTLFRMELAGQVFSSRGVLS